MLGWILLIAALIGFLFVAAFVKIITTQDVRQSDN